MAHLLPFARYELSRTPEALSFPWERGFMGLVFGHGPEAALFREPGWLRRRPAWFGFGGVYAKASPSDMAHGLSS